MPKNGPRILEDGLPHRWRMLDDDDIEQVLDALPMGLRSAADPGALQYEINDEIDELADIVVRMRVGEDLHVKLRRLRKLRGSLLRTLRCLGDLGAVQFSLDHACVQLSPDDLAAHELTARSAGEVIDGLKVLRLAIAACETEMEQRQTATKTKTAPRQTDYARYSFIATLACIFEECFGMPPSQTHGGPWCIFLAAVLSRCESKEIEEDEAYRLWKNLRNDMRLSDGAAHRRCAAYVIGPVETEELPQDWAARIAKEDAQLAGLTWAPGRARPLSPGNPLG